MTGAQLAPPRAARRSRAGTAISPIVLLVAIAIAGALLAWRLVLAPPSGSAVDMSAIEQAWGIRLTQIGVTADGGLVDVRYQVVDTDKALTFLGDPANMPILIAEDTNLSVRAMAMANKHDVVAGRTYFILFRNTGGAIHSGGQVTVAFGPLRLEHLVAL